ncbi:MAG: Hsp20/alpha crystallin family protein [Patulibacter sp.]
MATDRDLFAGFERMRREMDELFGDVFDRALAPRRAGFSPRIDVYYTQSPPAAVIAIDLAGIAVDELTVDVQGRGVRIAGRRPPVEAAGRVYQQLEIEHGPFERVIELGADVESEAARATYVDGMLEIELPLARRNLRSHSVQVTRGDDAAQDA